MLNYLYMQMALPGESDSEQTPRQRGKSRANHKRISETQDRSFTEDANPGRVPLKAVNINDDSAEKRRRKKRALKNHIDNSGAGPSNNGRQDDTEDVVAHAHSRHKTKPSKSNIVETPIKLMYPWTFEIRIMRSG